MSVFAAILLGVLTVWDYPARQPKHEVLRNQFLVALREGDTETMIESCKKGVELLPDEPTWHYNLACSLAYCKNPNQALDELEKAIDLGFRNVEKIKEDNDLKRLANLPRFKELLEYADSIRDRPIFAGPLAVTYTVGVAGVPLLLSSQNLMWDFDRGCFDAQMKLTDLADQPYAGLLYFNRDGGHSMLVVTNYLGLTSVGFDMEGRKRGMDLDAPNTAFPYPVIGNVSRAMTVGPYWRSLPRALMTSQSFRLGLMNNFYLSNQFWVYPAAFDCPPAGTNGNVFASAAPYWLITQGASWTDQYYVRAALLVWKSLKKPVREEIIRRGMLAPVLQMLMRAALKSAPDPEDYFTPKANPTAFPPNGLDLKRLAASAAALTIADIPPVATITRLSGVATGSESAWPELTYVSPSAWAVVLRTESAQRTFIVSAAGGEDYRFAIVHDEKNAAEVTPLSEDMARIIIKRDLLTPTNRVDVAVYARNKGTRWSAPSFVSFAVVDPKAPYSDPLLTPQPEPMAEVDPAATDPASK